MPGKNTKKTKTPLKKSAMKRVHGGADDTSSGVGSVSSTLGHASDPMPPILVGKAGAPASGSEISPIGVSGLSRS